MMESAVGAILALAGLALGIFLSRIIRRRRGESVARKRAATPTVYASRQDMRRAERERRKKESGRGA